MSVPPPASHDDDDGGGGRDGCAGGLLSDDAEGRGNAVVSLVVGRVRVCALLSYRSARVGALYAARRRGVRVR